MGTRRISILGLLLVVGLLARFAVAAAGQPEPKIDVYSSPHGGCTEAVVKELNATKESVLVQAYSFTSAPIAKALVDAHRRGVKVQVLLDKSQRTERYSSATLMKNC